MNLLRDRSASLEQLRPGDGVPSAGGKNSRDMLAH